jgi:nucleoside-diphosphate-sugar epimerase
MATQNNGTQKGLILVTGATSFVGTHVIKQFLQNGYHVRGQARSENSAKKVYKAFPDAGDALTTVIVPDITAPNAFDEAVKGVAGVIHTASPFVLQVQDNERDLLDPAVKGTMRLLEAVAAHAPQVKRVVITSSFASILDPAQGHRPGYTYTEKDWNPVTYEEAKAGPGPVAYCGSKKFAEKAAWDFVEEKKPNFTVSTICPPMIYGPVEHDTDIKSLNTSIADFYRFMDGSQKEPGETAFPAFADVRDVGLAHLRAYERSEPGRFFITSGNFENRDVCRILRETLPSDRKDKIPDPEATARAEFYKVDNSRTGKELGMSFTPLDKCVRDTAMSLVALEQGKTWREVSGGK